MPENSQAPQDWGDDSLSDFLNSTHQYTLAAFAQFPGQYKRLAEIDKTYNNIIENLHKTPDWFSGFFLYRAHSSYRGAVSLSLSGQVSETYMLLRGCLENALYGLYLSTHDQSQETWWRRHESDIHKKRVRSEFTTKKLMDCLHLIDTNLHDISKTLYEETIDWGAHPNEHAISQQLIYSETTDKSLNIRYDYLFHGDLPFQLCVRKSAQVGVCSLKIFRHVFRERYDLLGISEKIKELEDGL